MLLPRNESAVGVAINALTLQPLNLLAIIVQTAYAERWSIEINQVTAGPNTC